MMLQLDDKKISNYNKINEILGFKLLKRLKRYYTFE